MNLAPQEISLDVLREKYCKGEESLWLPSGGHVEPGEHPRATAACELYEELGLELSDALEAPLMLTASETVGITAGHTDVLLWYVINADRAMSLSFEAEEFNSVQWFHFGEAPVSRSDPHLARFLVACCSLWLRRAAP